MPRRRKEYPEYRLHKSSGQGIVTLTDPSGKRQDVLLGVHDTPESRTEYDRVVAEWVANGRRLVGTSSAVSSSISINEVILAYYTHAQTYYRHPDGTPTSELKNVRDAMRPLKALYGTTPAQDFDTLKLEAVRGHMIGKKLCRNRINKDTARIRRMFKWAASKKLVAVAVWQSLQTVEGLRAGRSDAVETDPVRPVEWPVVEATLPFLRPQVAAMVLLQWHTGMRPGEVLVMRGIDLKTGGDVWEYRPGSDRGPHGAHKTAWRGQTRVIFIGPKGQEVLKLWLRPNLTEYLFQPREAEAQRDAERRRQRKSKVTPSQAKRKPKANPKRQPGSRYQSSSYCAAIIKAIEKANAAANATAREEAVKAGQDVPEDRVFVPSWAPNQLRHAKATEIRREAGLDMTRAVLGHKNVGVTEVYAEVDAAKAADVMRRLG